MTSRAVVVLAALFGLVAVAAGAFAAHGLERAGDAQAVAWVETASRYQMAHALAMLATAALFPTERAAPYAMASGVVLFSGSLYLLAAGAPRAVALAAPFGGLALIAGWALLAWRAWREGPGRRQGTR